MKRLFSVIITIIIMLSSVLTANAESAGFTIQSAEALPNRIVSLNVNCTNSASLAAAVFEFSFDSSALEFRGCDSADGVKFKTNESDNNVKVVYYNQSKTAVPGGNIFQLEFKTSNEGSYDISFTVSGCVDHSANDISIGNCTGSTVKVSKNAVNSDNAAVSKSSSSSSDKEKTGKSSSKTSSKTSSKNGGEADKDTELEDNGELNDIEEKPGNSALILYILIGVGVLILMFTGIKIGMNISAKKNDKTNNN